MLHWLWVYTGIDGTGPWYGFWSGFGSDIAEFGILAAIVTHTWLFARAHNCSVPGCWHVSLRKTAAGDIACHKHHPEPVLSHKHLIERHILASKQAQP